MTLATSHLQRLVTGAALALLLTAGLALGGWVLVLLALVASSLALLEFYTMFWPCNDKLHMKAIGLVLGAGMLVAGHLDKPWLIVGCLAGAFLAGALQFLGDWGRGDDESRFADGQILAAGLLYVPSCCCPCCIFRYATSCWWPLPPSSPTPVPTTSEPTSAEHASGPASAPRRAGLAA